MPDASRKPSKGGQPGENVTDDGFSRGACLPPNVAFYLIYCSMLDSGCEIESFVLSTNINGSLSIQLFESFVSL